MPGYWTDKYVFARGASGGRDEIYLIIHDPELVKDDVPSSAVIVFAQGQWWTVKVLDWTAVAATAVTHPCEQVVALGELGRVLVARGSDCHEEACGHNVDDAAFRGTLRCLATIDGRAYAAGMDRQVFRRDGDNRWTALDDAARMGGGDEVVGFEAIGGFSATEVYAAGWGGEIWRYDGRSWSRLDSPTNLILTGLCCADTGDVYLCGRAGTLLRGRLDTWEIIDHGSTGEDLWSVAWFDNTLYAASLRLVYRLEERRLVPVDFAADPPGSCGQLCAREGVLWSIGARDVMAFDGSTWTRID